MLMEKLWENCAPQCGAHPIADLHDDCCKTPAHNNKDGDEIVEQGIMRGDERLKTAFPSRKRKKASLHIRILIHFRVGFPGGLASGVRCSVEILELDEFEILHRLVLIPDPNIMVAALKDCRRLNDYALAIRFLEAAKDRCGDQVSTIYPYLLQELRPKLCELGIEELGYDKPELAITLGMEK
ncbi:hypothetical protein quinque_013010 [Culex quinquefasciatus]